MPGTSTRKFIPLEVGFARRVKIYNATEGTLSEGDPVYVSSGTWTACADSNTTGIHGVVCEDIATLSYGWIWIEGVFKATVAGTIDFAQGGPVYTAASGTVDTGTQGDVSVGYVVGSEPASGATTIELVLTSLYLATITHA